MKPSLNEQNYLDGTLAKALCVFYTNLSVELSESEQKSYKSALYLLLRHFSIQLLTSLTSDNIRHFKKAVQKKHKTPKTLNKALDILRSVYGSCDSRVPNIMLGISQAAYPSKSKKGKAVRKVITMDPTCYREETVAWQICKILEHEQVNFSSNSITDKKSAYRKIIHVIGEDKLVSELTIDDFHDVRTFVLKAGKTSRTWNKVYLGLKKLNDYALSKKDIQHAFIDPSCGYIKPAKPKKMAYEHNDINKIYSNKADDEMSWLLLLLSYHLLTRSCEIIALTLGSISFEIDPTTHQEVANVTISLSKSKGNGDKKNPRNHCYKQPKDNETRVITVDTHGTKLLKRAITLAKQYPEVSYYRLSDDNVSLEHLSDKFLFINPKTNKPWQSSGEFSTVFLKDYLLSLNIHHLGLSKIRNTGTSHLLESGVTKTKVKEMLGHSNTSKCLEEHYEVPSKESKVNDAKVVNSHFNQFHSRKKISNRRYGLFAKATSFVKNLFSKRNDQYSISDKPELISCSGHM